MRGMILAAGRGTRMGQLTDDVPKPLLRVAGSYLIEHSIDKFVKLGIRDIVINVSYRAEQIKDAIGNGERYGVMIHYSHEEEALETGGGIFQALPLLGRDAFIVLSSDVISDYSLENLPKSPQSLAHLVLVDNPAFHPRGDFSLEGGRVIIDSANTLTYANIGVYRPELFVDCKPGKFRLGDVIKKAIARQQVTGEYFKGLWHNLGTPADLVQLTSVPGNLQESRL